MIPSEPHDEFLELCALSTSGHLSQEDEARLREHLAVCPSCREARQQYGLLIDQTIPALAAEWAFEGEPGPSWSQTEAEKILFDRLAREEERKTGGRKEGRHAVPPFRSMVPLAPETTWRHIWMLSAAGLLLFLTLGLYAYWIGARRGSDVAIRNRASGANADTSDALRKQSPLEERLSDAAHERELARAELAARERELANLRRQLEHQAADIRGMIEAQERLEGDLRSDEAGKRDLVRQRDDLAQRLQTAETNSQTLQTQLTALKEQSSHDATRAKTLEARVEDFTRLLKDREAALDQQDQFLAHDRDIRELMGARDLYIAEVYDVADTGATKKPYGRVFYTKGRSLIFYAYDLEDPALKRDVTFQAWGRRGPDRLRAVNLGIFYEDNAAKKRWVLKLDDPKTLAEIDAVFVTVEHDGRKEKPSGKPLLFAYLRVNPNHP